MKILCYTVMLFSVIIEQTWIMPPPHVHLHCSPFLLFDSVEWTSEVRGGVKDERGWLPLWPARCAVIYYLKCHRGWMSGEGRAEETFTALLPFIPVCIRLMCLNIINTPKQREISIFYEHILVSVELLFAISLDAALTIGTFAILSKLL